jgi:UDP-N-acetylmuramate--alanine ligase
MGSNARLGRSQYLVAEADESDRSFLKLSPIIAVVTNIDREHMDCYRNLQDIKRAFLDFMGRVPFYGIIVACNDDLMLRSILPKLKRRMVSYGTRKGSDFRISLRSARNSGKGTGSGRAAMGLHNPSALSAAGVARLARAGTPIPPQISFFSVTFRDKDLGEFRLHVPGLHNVLNATAAIAVGVGLDIPVAQIQEALENFRGVDRRFQVRGQVAGITVIDDYGHHPTEIRATLAAAKQCGYRKIHVIFQPHRYTRTRDLMDEFATAFSDADSLQVLEIYAASEEPIEGITGESLAQRISETGNVSAQYASSFDDAVLAAVESAHEGDMLLTLGAGSVSQLAPMLIEKLEALPAVTR